MADATARLAVRKTYKLYIGGQFPRSESGRSYVVRTPRTARPLANAVRGSRKDLRDAVRAARGAFPGWAAQDRHEPRADAVPGRGAARGAARAAGRRGRRAPRASRRRAESMVDRSIDRLVWYAGWADKLEPGAGHRQSRWAPATSTSASRSRPGWWASSRPRRRRCWASCRASPRSIVSGNTAVVLASEARPLPAVTLTGDPGHERRAGRRHQPHLGPASRAGAVAGGAHGCQRHRCLGRARRPARRPRACRRREHEARRPAAQGRCSRPSTGWTTRAPSGRSTSRASSRSRPSGIPSACSEGSEV